MARRVSRADLVEMLTGLEPGYYYTKDLYFRYLAWAKLKGRDTVNVQSLGHAISNRLGPGWRSRGNQSKAWHITPEMLASRTPSNES